ncbi:MAG: hypothetical protein AAF335_04180 [Bacteroidota bacterium]
MTTAALQGHQIINNRSNQRERRRGKKNRKSNEGKVKIPQFTINPLHNLPHPKIGHSARGETTGANIYYHAYKKNIAFCDTEGFCGERQASSEDRLIANLAPYYALITNQIGGIVIVVASHDILATRGQNLKTSASFLSHYFNFNYMYPWDTDCTRDVLKELEKLTPLPYNSLSKFDNPLSQYINKQALNLGKNIYQASRKVLTLKRQIFIQSLKLGLEKKEKKQEIQELKQQLIKEKNDLKSKNRALSKDESLECVFSDSHIQTVDMYVESLDRISYYKEHAYKENFFWQVAKLWPKEAYKLFKKANNENESSKGVQIIKKSISVAALLVSPVMMVNTFFISPIVYPLYRYDGYLRKDFNYIGGEPIIQVRAIYTNGGFSYVSPDWNIVTTNVFDQNFEVQYQEEEKKGDEEKIQLIANAKNNGVVQPQWNFRHTGNYAQDVNCVVKMYAKKMSYPLLSRRSKIT